eukprot:s2609_g4.t1
MESLQLWEEKEGEDGQQGRDRGEAWISRFGTNVRQAAPDRIIFENQLVKRHDDVGTPDHAEWHLHQHTVIANSLSIKPKYKITTWFEDLCCPVKLTLTWSLDSSPEKNMLVTTSDYSEQGTHWLVQTL